MKALGIVIALLGLAACREDPGDPDYSDSPIPATAEGDGDGTTLPGPNPYEPGTPRLSLGAFYESGYSEVVAIDDVTTHYYIFVVEGSDELTYTQETTTEHIEGTIADRIELNGTAYWGGGIIWDTARDLASWSRLVVSLKSSDAAFSTLDVIVQSGATATETRLSANQYGFANDGEWHTIEVPLADFTAAGFDASQTRAPFILSGTGNAGQVLLVDNLYID